MLQETGTEEAEKQSNGKPAAVSEGNTQPERIFKGRKDSTEKGSGAAE